MGVGLVWVVEGMVPGVEEDRTRTSVSGRRGRETSQRCKSEDALEEGLRKDREGGEFKFSRARAGLWRIA